MDASSAAAGQRTQAPPATLLEVRDLRTVFRTEDGDVPAVDGVSFTLARGRTLGIVGESGCGKSVTSLSIMGLVPQPPARVSGEVRFEGVDLLTLRPSEMRELRGNRLAMIFQEPMTSLNPVYSVGSQIVEAIRIHRPVSRRAARERAIELLTLVGIPSPAERADAYPHQLSGGMRQRALVAMAIACGPSVLVADEPTSALDPVSQAAIAGLLRGLRRERSLALLLATHDLAFAARLCDEVAVLYGGRIVERGSTAEVLARPRHPYTAGLVRSLPGLEEAGIGAPLEPLAGSPPAPWAFISGCRFRDRCPRARDDCGREEPGLVEVSGGHAVACFHPLEAP